MLKWKASELTEEFGDKQCVEYMKSQLIRMGAPDEKVTVDFSGCNITDDSLIFILQALKELGADCTGLSESEMSMKERFMQYKFYYVPFNEFKKAVNLKVGEIVILTDNLFCRSEHSRVARVENITATSVEFTEYFKAYFRVESEKLTTHKEVYSLHSLYLNSPYLHRPVQEEREFIESVFIAHDEYNYKFLKP